jgi:peptidoglycan L-alanyl-D-glutamate endopeptidase CwlK
MSRDIGLLHPHIQGLCREFLQACRNVGLDTIITQTLRTKAEQTAIYAQGRYGNSGKIVTNCKYPQSPHCWGCAFDIAVKFRGQVTWGHPELYHQAGEIGKSLGLVWGGDFHSFVDTPHFEDPTYIIGKSVNTLKAKYKTPQNFINSWNESEGEEVEEIKITVGNETMQGFIKDGVSYAPVKQMAKVFDAKTLWSAAEKKVTVIKND